jgi:response regulator RpfG family c-di-GMP phosphodiesterase
MAKPYIICVDDEKIVLDSLKTELKKKFGDNYTIEVAESGEEALEILEEISKNDEIIPLIISDYIMPEMKGDEVLQKVKEIRPDTYSIMLTGQATIEGVTNAINKAGLYRYISKPWETNDLMMTITEALKSYEREKQIQKQNDDIRQQNEEIKQKNKEITEINENLDLLVKIRTKELEHTIEELLNVKIGKKAYIILFMVALTMFLTIDAVIEPLLQDMLHNFYIILGIKGIIAFLIKPLETVLEKYLHSTTRKKLVSINN